MQRKPLSPTAPPTTLNISANALQFAADVQAPGAEQVRFNLRVGPEDAPTDKDAVRTTDPRFSAYAKMHGRREQDMDGLLRSAWRRFAILFAGTALFVSGGIAFGSLLWLPLAFVLALHTARAAHGHWQLRVRRLGTFREWLLTPSAWWPPSARCSQTLLLTYEPALTLDNLGGNNV